MELIQIDNVKSFMTLLFSEGCFDSFFLKEADILTSSRLVLSGMRCLSFYDTEECEGHALTPLCTWAEKKHLVFEAIKGRKLPVNMKLVLQVPEETVTRYMGKKESINYYLNIRFESNELKVITGTADNTFPPDREAPIWWDRTAREFLKENGVELC